MPLMPFEPYWVGVCTQLSIKLSNSARQAIHAKLCKSLGQSFCKKIERTKWCLVLPDGAAVLLLIRGFKNTYMYFFGSLIDRSAADN